MPQVAIWSDNLLPLTILLSHLSHVRYWLEQNEPVLITKDPNYLNLDYTDAGMSELQVYSN